MRREVVIFIIVLILNLIVSLVYFFLASIHKKETKRSELIRTIVMIFCPVVGPLFFLLSFLCYKWLFSEPVDLADVVFSKERVKTYVRPDEERERNIVPLEEAVEIMDKDNLRGVMMNVVRGDIQKSLNAIALALNSEDTETAHYAASILQDSLNEFRTNVQNQFQLVKDEGEEQSFYAESLLDYMNQVLRQKVFADIEQKNYADIMDQVGESLYKYHKANYTPRYYEALALRLLEVEDYDKCKKWCDRAIYHYPDALSTYTCQLKLYFASGQKEKFFRVMEDLRESNVVIDNETLEMLRVFMPEQK